MSRDCECPSAAPDDPSVGIYAETPMRTIVRQVWQGWWELVDIDTGHVLRHAWTREKLLEDHPRGHC